MADSHPSRTPSGQFTGRPPSPPSVPPPTVGERLASRFDLTDRRNLIGFIVLGFCAGVMVGARVMKGAVPPAVAPGPAAGPVVFRDVPCRSCAEKAVREARRAAEPPSTLDEEEAARAAAQAAQLDTSNPAPRQFSTVAEVERLPEDVPRDQNGRPVG